MYLNICYKLISPCCDLLSHSLSLSLSLSHSLTHSLYLSTNRQLNQSYIDDLGIHYLPGWKDPWGERPMTFGEIGCFLSHHTIWERVRHKALILACVSYCRVGATHLRTIFIIPNHNIEFTSAPWVTFRCSKVTICAFIYSLYTNIVSKKLFCVINFHV